MIGVLILGQIPRCEAPVHPQQGPVGRKCALFLHEQRGIAALDTADHADGVTSQCMVFRIETNSMLCLPPSTESHPSLHLPHTPPQTPL